MTHKQIVTTFKSLVSAGIIFQSAGIYEPKFLIVSALCFVIAFWMLDAVYPNQQSNITPMQTCRCRM